MDIPRRNVARRRRIVRSIIAALALVAVASVTLGLSKLEPAPPSVDRAAVWLDSVQQGEMLREVRGTGSLVPEVTWWIPATTAGRVEKILILPGAAVKADTPLLELSNPELELEAVNAEWAVKSAQANRDSLKVTLQNERLSLEASSARMDADLREAQLRLEVDKELFDDGLISKRNLRLSEARVEELKKLCHIDQQRLATCNESHQARIAAQEASVEQAKAMYRLKLAQVQSLVVRAGTDGILEQLPVEVGQRVASGIVLAKVTDVSSLKAVVRVPETQARDVQPGQIASIDTRNGIVPGRVVRIDPAVSEGTVAVDVSLEGELPKGARPDLTIVGTIELERLDNVLYVGRPVFGQANSTLSLFKIVDDGRTAVRVQVEIGRSSVNTVEIVRGLELGEEVILSDMSRWDEFDKVRLR